jgi:hypothetical protein
MGMYTWRAILPLCWPGRMFAGKAAEPGKAAQSGYRRLLRRVRSRDYAHLA